MLPRTKYEKQAVKLYQSHYTQREAVPSIKHNIDQFIWFDQGMIYADDERTLVNISKKIRGNAIQFTLPRITSGFSQPAIVVRANANEVEFEAYFFGRNKDNREGMWQIFSYESYTNKRERNPDYPKKDHHPYQINPRILGLIKPSLKKTKPLNVFTTEITPFLKQPGEYPDVCDRIYSMPLNGSDTIEVIAESRKKAEDERISLWFVPDGRDAKPQEIISFKETDDHFSWYSPELESSAR